MARQRAFDKGGALLDARIEDLGTRAGSEEDAARARQASAIPTTAKLMA